jgi:hypothetical protein
MLGIMASSISGSKISTSSYESIASATGTGSSGTITFSSIPSTYVALQLRIVARTDTAFTTDFIQFRANSDSGANYAYHGLEGDGSATTSFYGTLATVALGSTITGASASSNMMGAAIIDIIDYASANKYKTIKHFGGADRNTAGSIRIQSNLWLNTSAINSITITSYRSANWTNTSTFALYGIKGA